MDDTALTTRTNGTPVPVVGAQIERVLIDGDLAQLNADQRTSYYNAVCTSLGLNPLTQPFAYIRLNNKLTLYAKRDCTDQLRKVHGVSVTIASREVVEDCYVVTARATDRAGRTDESVGAVAISGIRGEARANALMKTETKAKRRVTLSICGLGLLDETETETVPGAQRAEYVAPKDQSPPPVAASAPSGESGAAEFTQTEPMATPSQVKALAVALGEIGIKDKDDRLRWISGMVGRDVASSKNLQQEECSRLIAAAKNGKMPREAGSD